MNVLDLFSGIGGFSLGLERAGFKTVAFCEIDPFCRKVLAKHWPDVPCYEDIRELDGSGIKADVITGGFPCQPYSHAGKRRGKDDDRHLWPEMLRVIRECGPDWVIGENTYGLASLGLQDVLSDMEALEYQTEVYVIPACAVGRSHWRKRLWILAYPMQRVGSMGRFFGRSGGIAEQISRDFLGEDEAPSRMVRKFDGIPNGLDRIKSLGNAVVPQIPEIIGRAIMESIPTLEADE